MVRPDEAAPLKITRINKAWKRLVGEELFVDGAADLESAYRRFASTFSELFRVMRDDWQWQPQDWLDIQGFLWIAIDEGDVELPATTAAGSNDERSEVPMPVNLILYGPPGTGKTYSTAAEAVGLCGEAVPGDRGTLMEVYQGLLAAGRIEFVTFHQSMSLRGLRGGPPTGGWFGRRSGQPVRRLPVRNGPRHFSADG